MTTVEDLMEDEFPQIGGVAMEHAERVGNASVYIRLVNGQEAICSWDTRVSNIDWSSWASA